MRKKRQLLIVALAISMQNPGCSRTEISYLTDVNPIFEAHCIDCHNGDGEGVETSGFSVADYASLMKGTRFGKVIVPGSSISSSLYLVVSQKTAPEIQMPPHHIQAWAEGRGSPLSKEDVATIASWIDQGARDN